MAMMVFNVQHKVAQLTTHIHQPKPKTAPLGDFDDWVRIRRAAIAVLAVDKDDKVTRQELLKP